MKSYIATVRHRPKTLKSHYVFRARSLKVAKKLAITLDQLFPSAVGTTKISAEQL